MRILMITAIGYTSALIFSHYVLPEGFLPYFALAFFVSAFFGFIFKNKTRAVILLLCFSAALGFGWSWLHSALFIRPAEALIGSELSSEVQVLEVPGIGDGYSTVLVRLKDDALPACKVLVTDYDGGFTDINPGDTVKMDLSFRSARIRYNAEDDHYFSSGIFLRAKLKGEYSVVSSGQTYGIYYPKLLADDLKDHILALFPEDVAPLMKALLTGDKTELYQDDSLYVAFRLSGLSHIIAVSGMHVSFIISLISIATGRRRMTAFLGIPLVWFFAAMMGFGPSVTRASLMISLMLLAPILRRENDPPTSLSAALLLLLIINPRSIASISLQLSFAAMAGIILVTPRIYRSVFKLLSGVSGIPGKLLRSAGSIFSASVGAMIFTTPLVALHFGYVPLYSIFSNLLCLWAMSTAFMLAYPAATIGAVYFPLGKLLAWLIAWLPRYTIYIVKHIARLPGAALYTSSNLVSWWLIYAYIVMFAPWLMRGDKAFRPVIPICCCLITLPLTLFLSYRLEDKGPSVTALDVGQGQCVVATGKRGAVVMDCGGKGTALNAGDIAAEYLLSSGHERVELLILTHLHDDHANGVVRLMNYLDVERIVLPSECESTEVGDSILKTCYDMGTEVKYISENTCVRMDGLKLDLIAPIGSADPNEMGLIILGDYGEFEFVVMGDAGMSTEEQLVSFYSPGQVELLVVGHHGSKASTGDVLLDELRPETAFISVGPNNYGHPTKEVLDRLEAHGAKIYRTDINGNISIMAGSN